MKEYDLELTDENIKNSINKDELKRNSKINKFIELLNNINCNKIISVDGKWGSGKTIFLKKIEIINKANEEDFEESTINIDNVRTFNNKYYVYYYNAWQNDLHTSPLLSLIYNLINDFPEQKGNNASQRVESPFNFIDALKTISANFVDLDKIKSFKDLTTEIYTLEEKKEALNNIIDNILPHDKKLLFIVDELDRCRPNYAIQMLEVIKHLYLNDRIIFVLGTNNEQLSHTISNYYGANFDGYGYLSKFYNLIIELDDISSYTYLTSVIGINDSTWRNNALHAVCNHFKFQMRDINRILNDFDLLNEYFNTSSNMFYDQDYILKYVFLPYCLGLKIKNKKILSDFLTGKGYDDLEEYVISNNEIYKIVEYDFKDSKTLSDLGNINKEKVIEYLKNKYKDYFVKNENNWEIKERKESFLNIFSLLSSYTKF